MSAKWKSTTLKTISRVSAGNSAPQEKEKFTNGTHPFFRTSDTGQVKFGCISNPRDYLNNCGIEGLRKFSKGTILFPKSGASTFNNYRVMMAEDGYVSSHLAAIIPDETQIDGFFLLYYLSTIFAQDLVQDHSYPSLNLSTIEKIPVKLPPLPEQKRIVSILDESFKAIDIAKANTEKNIQNARALFESYTQKEFEELEKRYTGKPLTQVCSIDKEQGYYQELAYIGLENIEAHTGVFIGDKSPKEVKSATFKFTREHVLYGRLRPYLNKVLVPNFTGHCSTEIFPLKPKPELKREFLSYWLMRTVITDKVNSTCTGARMPRANMNHVMKFMIHLPEIETQNSIVIRLDGIKEEISNLETIYQKKLVALEELKKSLLHQAFNGEL